MQNTDRNTDGYRLKRLEVYNWGVFHHKIWSIDLDGQNGLLTGEIGSGKSTLVDAISTLLVPSQKIVFNKAAGATSKERDLRSYVMGYFKSQSSEYGTSKPIALRPDRKDYSVILAVFHNEQLKKEGIADCDITLALVLYMTNTANQPEKLFVTAEQELSIKNHFTDFGKDPAALRKKLRALNVSVFDSFPQYSAWWKRRFGIGDNDQAIDLFAQTVSMKTVENISSFVQSHMLQEVDADEKIEDIIDRFNDLNSTYESVCRARDMLNLLAPMQSIAEEMKVSQQEAERFTQAKTEIDPFIGIQRRDLLNEVIESTRNNLKKENAQIESLEIKKTSLENDLEKCLDDRRQNGGEQLESLQRSIRNQENIISIRKARAKSFEALLKLLNMNLPRSVNGFTDQQLALHQKNQEVEAEQTNVQNELIKNGSEKERIVCDIKKLEEDISYISAHPSNISINQLKIREKICEDLKLDANNLPFAGELIEVKENQKNKWEGAIERVLHGFALSMLVPDAYYQSVVNYVDKHDLKGRLIYYRIKKDLIYSGKPLYPEELRTKLTIKDKGEFTEFVRQHLDENFAYICTGDYEKFKREYRAVTPNGQIKSGNRHEKDDRRNLTDKRNYVLGWSNTDKILILNNALLEQRVMLDKVNQIVRDIKIRNRELQNEIRIFARLEEYKSYDEIDYLSQTDKLKMLTEEYRKIEEGSDVLRLLDEKIKNIKNEISQVTDDQNERVRKAGRLEGEISQYEKDLNDQNEELAKENLQLVSLSLLKDYQEEFLKGKTLTLNQCDKLRRELVREIESSYKLNSGKQSECEKKLITMMADFRHRYEAESQEMDDSAESWPQYEELLAKIRNDDLPRFEGLFKKKLKDNTLNDIATLNAFLDTSAGEISKRIDVINNALKSIEYNPGRHIQLVTLNTEDQEIRQFKFDLRQMIDNRSEIDSGSLEISEERFLKVKDLIERFKGRADSVEADRRWRHKVTDVRRWYEFGAQELYDEDGSQYEYYKDSSGKSGGQKEKLAYTILATSLAYQFGTGFDDKSSDRSFRFVIIDEAFGRGSDESASFGLELFKKLKLQLLVVTPMQKISIIEPYVEHVAMVSKDDGSSQSSVRNLTIKEYRLLKQQRELLKNTRELEPVA